MICPYCGESMRAHGDFPKRPKGLPRPQWRVMHKRRIATRDHIVPRSRGGTGQRTVRVCHQCNQEKGNLTLAEYRALRYMRYGQRLFAYERQIPVLAMRLLWIRIWWITRYAL